jgi:hypothetical protein
LYRTIRRPALVLHGDQDRIIPYEKGQAVAAAIGAPLITLEGAGHIPTARDPVIVNRLIRDFVDRSAGAPPQAPVADPPRLAAAARCICHRRSARPAARPRDRPRAARGATWPGDRLAGAASGDGAAGKRGRVDASGKPPAGQ